MTWQRDIDMAKIRDILDKVLEKFSNFDHKKQYIHEGSRIQHYPLFESAIKKTPRRKFDSTMVEKRAISFLIKKMRLPSKKIPKSEWIAQMMKKKTKNTKHVV